jgi:hypothetical protein
MAPAPDRGRAGGAPFWAELEPARIRLHPALRRSAAGDCVRLIARNGTGKPDMSLTDFAWHAVVLFGTHSGPSIGGVTSGPSATLPTPPALLSTAHL